MTILTCCLIQRRLVTAGSSAGDADSDALVLADSEAR